MLNGEVFSLFDISEFRLCRKLVLICSAVLIQHRLMTDGQTDRHRAIAYTALCLWRMSRSVIIGWRGFYRPASSVLWLRRTSSKWPIYGRRA